MRLGISMMAVLLSLPVGAQTKGALKVGDPAPDFALPATTGGEIRLSQFRGNKAVVLAFFPAAFTGGCTKEVTGYQSSIERLAELDAQVLAVSTDNLPTLRRWAEETDQPTHREEQKDDGIIQGTGDSVEEWPGERPLSLTRRVGFSTSRRAPQPSILRGPSRLAAG